NYEHLMSLTGALYLFTHLNPFTELVQALRESLQPPTVMPSASACPMAKPVTYSGEASACWGFLLQFSLYFELQPHQFVNDRAMIALISLMSGSALPLVRFYDASVDNFCEVFGKTTSAVSVHDELFQLRQETNGKLHS
uniref:Uncharacterized protein n=1 Tax=Sinocyclocheilus rhinocerous TaxID=307959 RepID=A0A673LLE2_9TELE